MIIGCMGFSQGDGLVSIRLGEALEGYDITVLIFSVDIFWNDLL